MTANPHIDRLREFMLEGGDEPAALAALDALAADLDAANSELCEWRTSIATEALVRERAAAIRERDEARVTLRIEMDMGERWRKQSLAAEARVAELERERDAWASSHAERDKLLWAADAHVAELETALRKSDAMLSLLRYRATINWGTPGIPDQYDVDKTITQSRAALAAASADTETRIHGAPPIPTSNPAGESTFLPAEMDVRGVDMGWATGAEPADTEGSGRG